MSIFMEGMNQLLILMQTLLLHQLYYQLTLARIVAFIIHTVLFDVGDATSGFVMEKRGALALQALILCSTLFEQGTSRVLCILKAHLAILF
jgi:hypothetical protein